MAASVLLISALKSVCPALLMSN